MGRSLSPSIVTTWVSVGGCISCTCARRTSRVARVRVCPRDADCNHARKLGRTRCRLAGMLGVPELKLRREFLPLFDMGEASIPSGTSRSLNGTAEDWDTTGPIETFRTGQTIVAVVAAEVGACKVLAPVKLSRKSTSCAFCDTASAFSCVHALSCRRIKRGHTTKSKRAADGNDAANKEVRSRQPLPIFNCPSSV